jgi:hypothetical protein
VPPKQTARARWRHQPACMTLGLGYAACRRHRHKGGFHVKEVWQVCFLAVWCPIKNVLSTFKGTLNILPKVALLL